MTEIGQDSFSANAPWPAHYILLDHLAIIFYAFMIFRDRAAPWTMGGTKMRLGVKVPWADELRTPHRLDPNPHRELESTACHRLLGTGHVRVEVASRGLCMPDPYPEVHSSLPAPIEDLTISNHATMVSLG